MLKKVLYLVFISFIIISVIESVYLFNYIFYKPKKSSDNTTPRVVDNNVIDNSSMNNPLSLIPSQPQSSESGALNMVYIDFLKNVKRDAISSANVTMLCKGIIEEVYNKPWVDPQGKQEYIEGYKLKDSVSDCQILQIEKAAMSYLKIYKVVNGQNQEITFNDLKVGDRITNTTVLNLLLPRNYEEAKHPLEISIIKL